MSGGRSGRVLATLYFANSAGAVVGVLLAGFWLVERFGMQLTMIFAGAANIAIAAVALRVVRRHARPAAPVMRDTRSAEAGRWLLGLTFLSAFASFLYEIAWIRMLTLVQGASTHAFETMLSAFILGIALGGLWIRKRVERYASPLMVLARVQVLMGLAALATLPAYHLGFDVMAYAMANLPRTGLGYAGYTLAGYLISAAVMVAASFFAGMTLPLITYVLYTRGRGESEIGAVYGWNTLGAICGIALGGLLLMPAIGLKNMLVLGAAVDIALGVAVAAMLLRRRALPSPRSAAAAATASVAVVAGMLFFYELDVMRMASGVFRHGEAVIADTSQVIHHADGRTATVNLILESNGNLAITTNGKVDAAIAMSRARGDLDVPPNGDEYTMVLSGALPLLYRPAARAVAVIGHGSGLTTHALLGSPAVERVDVIEIEPEMIRAAEAFRARVPRAYEDPRARYHIEDARAFFALAAQTYDVIVSEPSNPWVSGVASLYTVEFYRHAKRALAPEGVFVQWFQVYEMTPAIIASIVRSVGKEFTDYMLFAPNTSDIVMVASVSGRLPPVSDTLFAWPQMAEELSYLGIDTPAQLRLFAVGSRKGLAPLLENAAANSDYFPKLEFGAARARFMNRHESMLLDLARDPAPVLEMLSGMAAPAPAHDSAHIARVHPRFHDLRRAGRIAAELGDHRVAGGTGPVPRADDTEHLRRVRTFRPDVTESAWQAWFTSLFELSKVLVPNGGGAAIGGFVRSESLATALRRAPVDINDRIDFLLAVAGRDLARIRRDGVSLLAGPLQARDPAFHDYVVVSTAAACLTVALPEAGCNSAFAQLDRIGYDSPVTDLLRAQRGAR
ncbi:MAG TPA: methyltransferase domain-containing protein, partial [Burkholderiales bacterium]|nr:methyltransferase domain-containing protein [Burkholderiales bacterium]